MYIYNGFGPGTSDGVRNARATTLPKAGLHVKWQRGQRVIYASWPGPTFVSPKRQPINGNR